MQRSTTWILPLLLLPAAVAVTIVGACGVASAQQDGGFAADAASLVRRAAANEVRANEGRVANSPYPVRYKLHKADEKGVTTKEIAETKDGAVARLIAIDDKPLTPEQEQAEIARLQRLMDQPELQEHRRKREKEDEDRINRMLRMMPDAFLYSYAGTVQGPSGPAIRLSFTPNPGFIARDHESRVFTGMMGELWIDKVQERMVRIDAHLFQDVDFGWGILGRLYKGGSIRIESADIGNHHWEVVRMKLDLTGRALMLKYLTFRMTEYATGFQPLPKEMGYQDAIRLLETRSAPAGQVAGWTQSGFCPDPKIPIPARESLPCGP